MAPRGRPARAACSRPGARRGRDYRLVMGAMHAHLVAGERPRPGCRSLTEFVWPPCREVSPPWRRNPVHRIGGQGLQLAGPVVAGRPRWRAAGVMLFGVLLRMMRAGTPTPPSSSRAARDRGSAPRVPRWSPSAAHKSGSRWCRSCGRRVVLRTRPLFEGEATGARWRVFDVPAPTWCRARHPMARPMVMAAPTSAVTGLVELTAWSPACGSRSLVPPPSTSRRRVAIRAPGSSGPPAGARMGGGAGMSKILTRGRSPSTDCARGRAMLHPRLVRPRPTCPTPTT